MVQLLREISHENVVKLVNVHINQVDMSLYLAFDYAEHDLYVRQIIFPPQRLWFTLSLLYPMFFYFFLFVHDA